MKLATILFATTIAGCVFTTDDSTELTVSNQSSYTLIEVHVAAASDPDWGPNLLPDVLYPDEDLTIVGLECDTYDVLVTDDTGVDCELDGLDLCGSSDTWVIDDVTLDVCAFAP